MKPILVGKTSSKNNGYQSDDENVRYKINTEYFNKVNKSPAKLKKAEKIELDDDTVRYKFPTVLSKGKSSDTKSKPKPKIKVNFWSNKQVSRLNNSNRETNKQMSTRRHTVGAIVDDSAVSKKSSAVKVRKRVSFLPSPIFSENHVPMVTVPDDLTIQLNEEEANDLAEDLNLAFVNANGDGKLDSPKRKSHVNQVDTKEAKRKRSLEAGVRVQGNESELEYFSKYIVQKLRRMETNQRIYSENLINTVLMLGQLGKLNGKSKIGDT